MCITFGFTKENKTLEENNKKEKTKNNKEKPNEKEKEMCLNLVILLQGIYF